MTHITLPRATVEQALALIASARLCEVNSMSSRQEMLRLLIEATDILRAALAQQAEPVEPVAWESWWLHHGQHNYRAKPFSPERVKELMKLAFEVGREATLPQHAEPVSVAAAMRDARLNAGWGSPAQQAEPVEPMAWANIDSDRLRVDPATGNVSIGAQQAEPVRAWMDPATGDVISDARHEAWERDFGLAGKGKAALFTVPLYTAPPQQAEPVPGKVVAWGVFAKIDGEWQLQAPVFVGDERGKENAEFERASYSGPQPLEVRPLGVVTATAQQAEPVEPAGRVVSANCEYATVQWLKQTSDVGGGDLKNSRSWPIAGDAVYTAPPQRKPLTDEDILRVLMLDPPNPSLWPHLKGEAIVGDVQQAVLAIVRAVERALEEKNRGR